MHSTNVAAWSTTDVADLNATNVAALSGATDKADLSVATDVADLSATDSWFQNCCSAASVAAVKVLQL